MLPFQYCQTRLFRRPQVEGAPKNTARGPFSHVQAGGELKHSKRRKYFRLARQWEERWRQKEEGKEGRPDGGLMQEEEVVREKL